VQKQFSGEQETVTSVAASPPTPALTFLSFVMICGKSRRGDFQVERKSRRDRMRGKLREIKGRAAPAMAPIPDTGK
jgi:hypothetical protein